MNLQTGSTRTGFGTVLPPPFVNAEPELNLATMGNSVWQTYLSGTRVAIACNQGMFKGVLVTPCALPNQRTYGNRFGTVQSCVFEGGNQYLKLIDVPYPDEGLNSYHLMPRSLWSTESNGLVVFGYTSQPEAATGFVMNAKAGYVTDTTLFNSQQSCNLDADTAETLTSAIQAVFASAEFVEFQDGIENAFTNQLIELVKGRGAGAILKLETMIFQPGVRTEITAQILLCLGRIDASVSASARSRVVRRGLKSSSAKVRDAAAVAVSSMADATAISDLSTAIKQESIPSLKQDMRDILEQLQTSN